MKLQNPAEGIMQTGEYGDSKFYKVVCGCGQPDHDINFEVEADECGINVNTYVTVKTDYWGDTFKYRHDIESPWLAEFDYFWKDVANGFIRRVKWTWRIWTQGYVKAETTIAMTEQQALNYAETIKLAIQDVKDFKKP
jgi:hypothetical protein